MEKNVRWKHPDGAGGFTELNLLSSAELVAYGAGTVKDELDNLSATTGTSTFMRSLLRANDAVEARFAVRVKKIFGTKYLNTAHGYLENSSGITLGGENFSIAFWAYAPSASTAAQNFFCWGTKTDCTLISRDSNNKLLTNAFANILHFD